MQLPTYLKLHADVLLHADYTEPASQLPTCSFLANFLAQPGGGSKSGLSLRLYSNTPTYKVIAPLHYVNLSHLVSLCM